MGRRRREAEGKSERVLAEHALAVKVTELEFSLLQLLSRGHVRSRERGEAFVIAYAAYLLGARRVRLVKQGPRYHVYLWSGRKKLRRALARLGHAGLRRLLEGAYRAYLRWWHAEVWKGVLLSDYFRALIEGEQLAEAQKNKKDDANFSCGREGSAP